MNADELFNAGLKSARAGDYYGAVINLRLAASSGNESAEIHRLIGKVHVHLGELDRAEDSFRRALALDSRDSGAAECLAALRTHRIMHRAASAMAMIAVAAVAALALWSQWQAYRRLDALVSSIAALNPSRPEAARRPESAVPAASRAETSLPPAQPQTAVAPPSSPAARPAPSLLPATKQSRAAGPAAPVAAKGPPAPAAAKTAPPAAPPALEPRPLPLQPDAATPLFESQYKEAVAKAFKGDLKQALVLLSALSGDKYAGQPLAGNVHFWMGRCLYELGQPREALDHFQQVLKLYPKCSKRGEALIDVERCQRKLQQ